MQQLATAVVAIAGFGLAVVATLGWAHSETWTWEEEIALKNGWEATGPVRVIDGDTLELRGVKVRLQGIDAPEASQICVLEGIPYGCGVAATLHLENLIGERDVRCLGTGDDRYGRQLAWCVAGTLRLNAQMVEDGMAMAYREYSRSYTEEEDEARAAHRGLWAGKFEPPWEWRRKRRGI